jgi:hypothetical protein
MGQGNSMPTVDGFSREEISRLEKRFHKLDLDRSGSISATEFLSIPELKDNPLVQRVVDVLDLDLSGDVDFKGKTAEAQCIFAVNPDDNITCIVHKHHLLAITVQ